MGASAALGFQDYRKNYRVPLGEIDVIAEKNGRLYFVEVKTRSGTERGLPEESVTLDKQRRLARLAAWYLQQKRQAEKRACFAVISVLWNASGDPQIRLIEDAFMLEENRY